MYLKNLFFIIFIVLLVLLVLLVFYIIYKNLNYKEHFANEDVLYITDNIYNFNSSLDIDLDTFNNALINFRDKKELLINNKNYDNLSLLIDPYVNYFYLNNTDKNNYIEYSKEGFFVYVTYNSLDISECIWDIENKTIAYVYPSDYYFIQAFIKGYKADINKINIIKINVKDIVNNKAPKFDILITYIIPNSTYMQIIEQSRYFINGFNDINIDRIKAFYPFLREKNDSVSAFFNNNNRSPSGYVSNLKSIVLLMNYVIVKDINGIKNINEDNNDIKESFITRLEMPIGYIAGKEYKNVNSSNLAKIEDLYNSREYGCYGNSVVNNKFECDSMYNIDGTGKDYYTIWDKKCDIDSECPFYNAELSKGGCLEGGFCELPIGVKRTGFMKYNDDGLNSALCYNCEDTTDHNCCKNNGVTLNDYAYPNDFETRVNKGLKSTVSPLKYII